MFRVRLNGLLEAEEGIVDCDRASPRLLGLGPFVPWPANVVVGHGLYIFESFNSHDYIDVAFRLSGLQCRLDVVVSNKVSRDKLVRFLLGHCLDSHRFKNRFTGWIAAYCKPFANGFRNRWWIYSFESLNLQPDWTILIIQIVVDTHLALEFGLVIKDVVVVTERKDGLLGLSH